MNASRTLTAAALTAGLVAALAPANASAFTLATRTILEQAVGLCGANNPANDQYLRRLVTGLKNAGTSNVSVVCSQWGDDANAQAAQLAFANIRNDKPTGMNVYCTLTMGQPGYSQVAITKGIYVPANTTSTVSWNTSNYGTNEEQQWVNLQCALPPGYALREIGYVYDEDIGT
jgi:hypothetical protein